MADRIEAAFQKILAEFTAKGELQTPELQEAARILFFLGAGDALHIACDGFRQNDPSAAVEAAREIDTFKRRVLSDAAERN